MNVFIESGLNLKGKKMYDFRKVYSIFSCSRVYYSIYTI